MKTNCPWCGSPAEIANDNEDHQCTFCEHLFRLVPYATKQERQTKNSYLLEQANTLIAEFADAVRKIVKLPSVLKDAGETDWEAVGRESVVIAEHVLRNHKKG